MGDPLTPRLRRRRLLAGLAAAAVTWPLASSRAMGRLPLGGTVTLRVPWSTAALDPHDLFDPLAALFGQAVFDPVYGRDQHGVPYPTLADGLPTEEDGQTVVRLRPGLRSARGKALGGRDLAWSIARARQGGAAGLFAPVTPWVRSDRDDPLIVRFGPIPPAKLALMLTSPLTALVPVGFSPLSPDGTGAFMAQCTPQQLVLGRNLSAARGPAFLDRVEVHRAPDLAASLRSFETGRDDLGWLGLGLYRSRPEALPFDHGHVGWIVLRTGQRAGRWAAPGVAQQLANAVPVALLPIGLATGSGSGGARLWEGGPAELLYEGGSGHLHAIAQAVAVKLSQPGHELSPAPVRRSELRRRRASGDYHLALDVVRPLDAGPISRLVALATADSAQLGQSIALRPPRLNYNAPAHRLTATMSIGILGQLDVRGGIIPGIRLARQIPGDGMDLRKSYRFP